MSLDGKKRIIACSSLKRKYRTLLASNAPSAVFFLLMLPLEVLQERVTSRANHFAKANLLPSQIADFEVPNDDEPNVFKIDGDAPPDAVVNRIIEKLNQIKCWNLIYSFVVLFNKYRYFCFFRSILQGMRGLGTPNRSPTASLLGFGASNNSNATWQRFIGSMSSIESVNKLILRNLHILEFASNSMFSLHFSSTNRGLSSRRRQFFHGSDWNKNEWFQNSFIDAFAILRGFKGFKVSSLLSFLSFCTSIVSLSFPFTVVFVSSKIHVSDV